MSTVAAEAAPARVAPLFAALGDVTRLSLLARLQDGQAHSLGELTEGLGLTRQGVTKHLRILEAAEMVSSRRLGRQKLFVLHPAAILEAKTYLDRASAQWDQALSRLATFVEND